MMKELRGRYTTVFPVTSVSRKGMSEIPLSLLFSMYLIHRLLSPLPVLLLSLARRIAHPTRVDAEIDITRSKLQK